MAWPSWVSKCRIGNLEHFGARIWVFSVSFSNEILHSRYWFWKMWHLQLELKWNLCSLRKKSTENLLQKIKANTESSGNIACILPCFHWKEEKRNYFSIWCFSIYLFLPTWSHHGPFPNLKVLRGGEMTVSKIMIGHRLKCGSKRVYIKWTFKCHGSSRISCFMLVDWFVSGWLNQTIVRHVCIIYVVHCIILWHVWWFDWWGA